MIHAPTNKIREESVRYNSFRDLPVVIFKHIEDELDKMTSEPIIQEQDDGSTIETVVDFSVRNVHPESTEDENRTYAKHCFSGSYKDVIKAGEEVEIMDDRSFMTKTIRVQKDQEVDFSFIVYYNIAFDETTEEVILKDALVHTFTYAEHLKEFPK